MNYITKSLFSSIRPLLHFSFRNKLRGPFLIYFFFRTNRIGQSFPHKFHFKCDQNHHRSLCGLFILFKHNVINVMRFRQPSNQLEALHTSRLFRRMNAFPINFVCVLNATNAIRIAPKNISLSDTPIYESSEPTGQ